jgi:hypothetical protein
LNCIIIINIIAITIIIIIITTTTTTTITTTTTTTNSFVVMTELCEYLFYHRCSLATRLPLWLQAILSTIFSSQQLHYNRMTVPVER